MNENNWEKLVPHEKALTMVLVKWVTPVESSYMMEGAPPPKHYYTNGFLVEQDEDILTIARDVSEDGGELRQIIYIPRALLRGFWQFKDQTDTEPAQPAEPVEVVSVLDRPWEQWQVGQWFVVRPLAGTNDPTYDPTAVYEFTYYDGGNLYGKLVRTMKGDRREDLLTGHVFNITRPEYVFCGVAHYYDFKAVNEAKNRSYRPGDIIRVVDYLLDDKIVDLNDHLSRSYRVLNHGTNAMRVENVATGYRKTYEYSDWVFNLVGEEPHAETTTQ